jgi:4-carboxymuconolactone decarboxylase
MRTRALWILTVGLGLLSLIYPGTGAASEKNKAGDTIHIVRGGTLPQTKGPEAIFTGDVTVDRLFPPNDPLNISGGYVAFAPGARTAWHSHPEGQMLIVTAGAGRVQQWGGPLLEIRQGDVVWFPAGVKHWHGAMPDSPLTHLALARIVDGQSSTWMEKVTDEQYSGTKKWR